MRKAGPEPRNVWEKTRVQQTVDRSPRGEKLESNYVLATLQVCFGGKGLRKENGSRAGWDLWTSWRSSTSEQTGQEDGVAQAEEGFMYFV